MIRTASLGEALARLRKRSGLTQKDIAEAMEITVSSVSRFEQPDVNPQWSKLVRFLDAIGCDLEDLHAELTGGDGDPLSEALEAELEVARRRRADEPAFDRLARSMIERFESGDPGLRALADLVDDQERRLRALEGAGSARVANGAADDADD